MPSNANPVVPIAWAEILENVEKTLAQAETDAARSEEALGPPDPPAAESAWQRSFDRLEEQFRRLQGSLAVADLHASQTEKSLQNSEETLKRWTALAEEMRRKLASAADLSLS